MDTKVKKSFETQRAGLLIQLGGIEELLGIQNTAALRKRYKDLQTQMDIIKAWAKREGHSLPL